MTEEKQQPPRRRSLWIWTTSSILRSRSSCPVRRRSTTRDTASSAPPVPIRRRLRGDLPLRPRSSSCATSASPFKAAPACRAFTMSTAVPSWSRTRCTICSDSKSRASPSTTRPAADLQCDRRGADDQEEVRGEAEMVTTNVIPFGPQHPVLPEPIQLRLTMEDEKDGRGHPRHRLRAPWHREAAEINDYTQTIFLVERICGICSFMHAHTYCQGDRAHHGPRSARPRPLPARGVGRAAPSAQPSSVAGAFGRRLRLREPLYADLAQTAKPLWTCSR